MPAEGSAIEYSFPLSPPQHPHPPHPPPSYLPSSSSPPFFLVGISTSCHTFCGQLSSSEAVRTFLFLVSFLLLITRLSENKLCSDTFSNFLKRSEGYETEEREWTLKHKMLVNHLKTITLEDLRTFTVPLLSSISPPPPPICPPSPPSFSCSVFTLFSPHSLSHFFFLLFSLGEVSVVQGSR